MGECLERGGNPRSIAWGEHRPIGRDAAHSETHCDHLGITARASIWDTAGYFSTSAETIERTYGHHSPNHQATAVKAMDMRG